MPEDAIELAVKALRQKMTATEERISELEDQLRDLRAERTQTVRGLIALDPTWRVDKRPKKGSQARPGGRYPVAEPKVDAVVDYLRENNFTDGRSFAGADIPLAEIGMSDPTRNAALNELARRGNLRIDRPGGGGRQKFFAVTRLPDE